MKDLKYYERLPEGIDQNMVELELQELLLKYSESIDAKLFLAAVYELSERQVINYSKINFLIEEKLTKFMIELWNSNSLESTRQCVAIMINFGLQGFYNHCKRVFSSLKNEDVRVELEETFLEFGEFVNDVSYNKK